MCLCILFPSFASSPFVCVPTSLTCIQRRHREPRHTPSTASIFAPPHRESPPRCQSTVAKSSCAPVASASTCRNRSYVVRIIIAARQASDLLTASLSFRQCATTYHTRPARSCLAGKAWQIVLDPMPGIRLARAHCSLSLPHRPQRLLKMCYSWRWYNNFRQSTHSTQHIACTILLNGSQLFLSKRLSLSESG